MASLTFDSVGKVYRDGTRAVDDLNLEVDDGEFTVFVGPSGCGKTTVLRMCAGLEAITEGQIRIGSSVVNTLDPQQRDVAMVFQNYALYPQMTVFENIAFPLRSRGAPRRAIRAQVESIAKRLAIEELLKRKPGQLSGGQRQRVAMGRALVRQPQVFLMDEPLSNLDAKLRVQLRVEIAQLQRELGTTTIYVTHDQVEAMTMGSRIAVMRKGRMQQVGPPQELYDRPLNLFVAGFVGSPAMNLVRARMVDDGTAPAVRVGEESFPVPPAHPAAPALAGYRGHDIALGIRPENVVVHGNQDVGNGAIRLNGEVRFVESLGFESLVHLEIAAEPVVTDELREIAEDIDPTNVPTPAEPAGQRATFIARAAAGQGGSAGRQIGVALPFEHVQFFSLATGTSIGVRDRAKHSARVDT